MQLNQRKKLSYDIRNCVSGVKKDIVKLSKQHVLSDMKNLRFVCEF